MVVAPYCFNPAKFSFHYSHESLCLIFEVVGIIVPMLYAGIHMESFVLEQLSAKWSSIGGQQKWLIIQGMFFLPLLVLLFQTFCIHFSLFVQFMFPPF
jgi:hypothetical protein